MKEKKKVKRHEREKSTDEMKVKTKNRLNEMWQEKNSRYEWVGQIFLKKERKN